MTGVVAIRNCQTSIPVDTRRLRRLARALLHDALALRDFDLSVCIVGVGEMRRLNETYLRHAGSTDVITFNYGESGSGRNSKPPLHGEIFICADEAAIQARRFRVSTRSELARYLIHGVLHLVGYDDKRTAARRNMKRMENRLLRELDAEAG